MPVSKQNRKARAESAARSAAAIAQHKEFTWWRDVTHTLHVPYGYLKGYKYTDMWDPIAEKWWKAHTITNSQIRTNTSHTSVLLEDGSKMRVVELRYSEEQYDLIRVSVWLMMEHGYKAKEVYNLLIHPTIQFPLMPGQTPLTARKVSAWKRFHVQYKMKGFLWP